MYEIWVYHNIPIPLTHHKKFVMCIAGYRLTINTTIVWKATIFCCDCESEFWISKVFL